MIFEWKQMIRAWQTAQNLNKKTVLASVVALEGSSYRRPGVRMLIREDGLMEGAVSGGCVEKEVLRQSHSVFETGIPKVITYDGRYRLGCEGILYILIEPFEPGDEFISRFKEAVLNREPVEVETYYRAEVGALQGGGTLVKFRDENIFGVHAGVEPENAPEVLRQHLPAAFRLLVIGAEHDAVRMCKAGIQLGWEVEIVAPADDARTRENFPDAEKVINTTPEAFDSSYPDHQTAIVLMNHSYVKDLHYLMVLQHSNFAYLGVLGPEKRRERLFGDLMEKSPDLDPVFLEKIHGPAGLDIGAETPEEIAVSVVAEILAVVRKREGTFLKNRSGSIHQNIRL